MIRRNKSWKITKGKIQPQTKNTTNEKHHKRKNYNNNHKGKFGIQVRNPNQPKQNIQAIQTNPKDTSASVEFLKLDYGIVHNEIIDIKTCRTNIFIGTVGILGAIAVGVLGLLGMKGGFKYSIWLPFATLSVMGILYVSLLSSVHKARGINIRVGYMKSLSKWLRKDMSPPYFPGWQAAREIVEHCQLHLNNFAEINKHCSVKKKNQMKNEKKQEPACVTHARKKASKLNQSIGTFPPLLHTFTSLSTYVYTAIFFIMIFALIFNTMLVTEKYSNPHNNLVYWAIAAAGFIITLAAVYYTINDKIEKDKKNQFHNEREKITNSEKMLKICAYLAGLLLLSAILIIMFMSAEKGILTIIAVYSLGFLISVVSLYAGYVSYDKIYSLRKGRYSIEHWYYVWDTCFRECPLMKELCMPPEHK